MLLSSSTDAVENMFGRDKIPYIFKEAGFDAFDFSFFTMVHDEENVFNGPKYREEAGKIRELADAVGIVCNQAHAPFASSSGDPEKDKVMFDKIVRSIEAAAIMGAKAIVVHPKQHLRYRDHIDELRAINKEFYRSLIPVCEANKIKVAVENMWQFNDANKQITESTCSAAKEFCDYVDDADSKWIVACLDVGHAQLMGADIPSFIRALGKDRLQCVHMHDVDNVHDLHTLPLTQKIDYEAVMKALGEIGYQGDFTFEADSFFKAHPIDLVPASLKYMVAVGRYLMSRVKQS